MSSWTFNGMFSMKRNLKRNVTIPDKHRSGRERVSKSKDDAKYLHLLGDNIRAARARRGMARKVLALHSGVSERFLAQLETGSGNASALILRQVARALDVEPVELIRTEAADPPNLVHTIEFLRRLETSDLAKARDLLIDRFGNQDAKARHARIALVGLRGAGKSTIGTLLAKEMNVPFLELDRLIEKSSGVSLSVIFDLYGQSGFRRLEHRCLEEVLQNYPRFVLATSGGLVSEPGTYDRLLTTCFTIWLTAQPEDHMSRVLAQGDMRPMAHNTEAMSDLKRIIAERNRLYDQADLTLNTSSLSIEDTIQYARQAVHKLASASHLH